MPRVSTVWCATWWAAAAGRERRRPPRPRVSCRTSCGRHRRRRRRRTMAGRRIIGGDPSPADLFDGPGLRGHAGTSVRERGSVMSRRRLVLGLSCALVASTAMWSTGGAGTCAADGRRAWAVYSGQVDAAPLAAIVALGVDRHELRVAAVGRVGRPLRRRGHPVGRAGASARRAGSELAPKTTGAPAAQALATPRVPPATAAPAASRRSWPPRPPRTRRSPSCR